MSSKPQQRGMVQSYLRDAPWWLQPVLTGAMYAVVMTALSYTSWGTGGPWTWIAGGVFVAVLGGVVAWMRRGPEIR